VTAAFLGFHRRMFASVRMHRNYRLFCTGQVVSLVGTWMQNLALAWLVIELTHSPLAVGLLVFCRLLPFTILGLVAGVAADRVDKRRLVMAMQAFALVVASALAVMVFAGIEQLWLVYLLAALGGAAIAMEAPARHALTSQLVAREELPNAIALNSSLFSASRIVGPSVAGVIVAVAGVGWCFALNAVSYLAVLAALWLMDEDALFKSHATEGRPTLVRGTREGLAYVWRTRRLRLILIITAVLATVGFNFHVLVPVLATVTLHGGPEVLGILSACFGAGALIGALLSASRGRASWRWLIGGVLGFSISLLGLALQHSVPAAAALLLVTGVCFTTWTANSEAILQLTAPDRLRGRVLGIYLWAFGGLAPFGGLLAGWLSEVGGTELAFSVAGLTGLALGLYALFELFGSPSLTTVSPERASGAIAGREPAATGAAVGE